MHSPPYPYPPLPQPPPAPTLPYASISTLILVYAVLSYVMTDFIHRYEESRTTGLDMENRPLGLSLRDLQALPWFHCEGDSGINCVICLESFQKADRCRCLPVCNHIFHARCIDLWLLQRLSCPTCRSPFIINSRFEAI